MTKRGDFQAAISFNKQIGNIFFRIGLEFEKEGAKLFADFVPGQFVQIDLSKASLPAQEKIPEDLLDSSVRDIILRRPFSFCNVTAEKEKTKAEILYCVVGPASLRLSALKAGDAVSVIGPLGNGFRIKETKQTALLAVGGMGAGPIIHLAKAIKEKQTQTEIITFVGAKTKTDLPFEKVGENSIGEFDEYEETVLATDDGSAGNKGFVTVYLDKWLDSNKTDDMIIYSCGPEAMLAEVAKIADKHNVDCQVSLERRMGCGIGLCQSCAVKCKIEGSQKSVYKMCCKDGPVFDSREVLFNL